MKSQMPWLIWSGKISVQNKQVGFCSKHFAIYPICDWFSSSFFVVFSELAVVLPDMTPRCLGRGRGGAGPRLNSGFVRKRDQSPETGLHKRALFIWPKLISSHLFLNSNPTSSNSCAVTKPTSEKQLFPTANHCNVQHKLGRDQR